MIYFRSRKAATLASTTLVVASRLPRLLLFFYGETRCCDRSFFVYKHLVGRGGFAIAPMLLLTLKVEIFYVRNSDSYRADYAL